MIYLPATANKTHIERHFAESLVAGSKFLPMSGDEVKRLIFDVDSVLASRLVRFEDDNETPERVVITFERDEPVGTDALVKFTPEHQQSTIDIVRDRGTEYEAHVKVIEATDIPTTNKITIVAGPNKDATKWGMYAMFPGAEAAPFPNAERQSEEEFASNTKFWRENGFLATKEEIEASLPNEPAASKHNLTP